MAHAHTTHPNHPKPKNGAEGKCHCPEPPGAETCCEMICFEHPNYFCGHLLTDADLKLDQRYFREKNKLYHRGLHGHGIVCGLRLTCHHECPGSIRIGEGLAIDKCGNDLVVCEAMPFDVLAALRAKDWLSAGERSDPCQPPPVEPECKVRQCFYVTICYKESEAEFTAPFMAGCRPKLSDCEPTRIREEVYFDVLQELPKERDWLEDLLARVTACFELFSKGPLAATLQSELLQSIMQFEPILAEAPAQAVGGATAPGGPSVAHNPTFNPNSYWELFGQLRGQFLVYLRRHPDQYNCTLEEEVRKLVCPDPHTEHANQRGQFHDAFCELLELILQHVVSCVLGELVPPCAEPANASCIVLGTVEVEEGRVVRVCNCPRTHVWSFAHLGEVVVATIFGELGCEEMPQEHDPDCEPEQKQKHVCCRKIDLDCADFVKQLSINPNSSREGAALVMKAIRSWPQMVARAFDFTAPGRFSPSMLLNMNREEAQRSLGRLGVKRYRFLDEPLGPKVRHPVEWLHDLGLASAENPLLLVLTQGIVRAAYADHLPPATDAVAESELLRKEIEQARAIAAAAVTEAQAATSRLARLEQEIAQLREREPLRAAAPATGGVPAAPGGPTMPEAEEPPGATPASPRAPRRARRGRGPRPGGNR